MLCVTSWSGSTTTFSSVPSPFTLLNSGANSTILSTIVFGGFAGAAEPESYAFTRDTSSVWSGIIVSYMGVEAVDIHDILINAANTLMAHPALLTTVADALLVALTGHNNGTITTGDYSHPTGFRAPPTVARPLASGQRNSIVSELALVAPQPGGV